MRDEYNVRMSVELTTKSIWHGNVEDGLPHRSLYGINMVCLEFLCERDVATEVKKGTKNAG